MINTETQRHADTRTHARTRTTLRQTYLGRVCIYVLSADRDVDYYDQSSIDVHRKLIFCVFTLQHNILSDLKEFVCSSAGLAVPMIGVNAFATASKYVDKVIVVKYVLIDLSTCLF